MHQSCGARARIEREPRLGPAVTRAVASARDTCSYAPPPGRSRSFLAPCAARGDSLGPPPPGLARSRGRSSSAFRGVTLHRRTKRWESHIWVRETGKQLYLGGFDFERAAAEAPTCARRCASGPRAKLNPPARDDAARSARARRHRTSRWSPRCARGGSPRGASRREGARTTPREVNEKVLPATPARVLSSGDAHSAARRAVGSPSNSKKSAA